MTTYARARLRLGMTGVGLWVVLACITLVTLSTWSTALASLSAIEATVLFIMTYLIVSTPLDWFGGFILPKRFERTKSTAATYLSTWLRGILMHGLLLSLFGFTLIHIVETVSWPWLLGIMGVLQLILLIAQPIIARLIASFQVQPTTQGEQHWACDDPGFTGGLTYWQGKSIMPQHWAEEFTPQQLALIQKRRFSLLQHPGRIKGILLALIFNLAGAGLCLSLIHHNQWLPNQVGPLSFLAAWASISTLWGFLGLLVLPTPSQQATLSLDGTAWKEEPLETIKPVIEGLDALQDKEPNRGTWLQRIFHPIANVSQRLDALRSSSHQETRGAYHVARYTLYLAWPTLSLVSRAVHCNSGRPHLWVFLPSDG